MPPIEDISLLDAVLEQNPFILWKLLCRVLKP